MDLTDIYRKFQPTAVEYSFFLAAHGTFAKIDHTLGHKVGPNKYKKTEIISCMLSDHNGIRLEIDRN
jgi:exonuclease III